MIHRAKNVVLVVNRTSLAPGAGSYSEDNCLNWSLFRRYVIEWFAAKSTTAGTQITLTMRTSAPADAGAVHDYATDRTLTTGVNGQSGAYGANSIDMNGGAGLAGSGPGHSAWVDLWTDAAGTARCALRAGTVFESTAGTTGQNLLMIGAVRVDARGFKIAAVAGTLTISSLRVWGYRR